MLDSDASRWRALQTRNPSAASSFVYAVKTTGIFCRPTCPARLARRANVVFFDSPADATAAGFRPCKRCRPEEVAVQTPREQHQAVVARACRILEGAGGQVNVGKLAGIVGLSPRYFHGIFKRVVGVTPGAYASRLRRASRAENGPPLTESIDSAKCPSERYGLCHDLGSSLNWMEFTMAPPGSDQTQPVDSTEWLHAGFHIEALQAQLLTASSTMFDEDHWPSPV